MLFSHNLFPLSFGKVETYFKYYKKKKERIPLLFTTFKNLLWYKFDIFWSLADETLPQGLPQFCYQLHCLVSCAGYVAKSQFWMLHKTTAKTFLSWRCSGSCLVGAHRKPQGKLASGEEQDKEQSLRDWPSLRITWDDDSSQESTEWICLLELTVL